MPYREPTQAWRALLRALGAALGAALATSAAAQGAPPAERPRALDVSEYRLEGASLLPQADVEAALEPFLGPRRPLEDVERARVALERAYAARGYQAVTVALPPQTVRGGVVVLRVTEGRIDRLRVRGARWFSPFDIRREAPSMSEGTAPNFDAIVRDIGQLNLMPDRRVTPAIRAGTRPGTVDVDLEVQDRFPGHATLEANNRHSSGTSASRLNGSLRYDNLWQEGHSLGLSFQVAPERLRDARVFTATYQARAPGAPWLSLQLSGTMQDSDVSTLGGLAVGGRGRSAGLRAVATLPAGEGFFHSATAGLDYRRFQEKVGDERRPTTHWPLVAQYAAGLAGGGSETQATVTATLNLRTLSSSDREMDERRIYARGSFVHLRADLSHTRGLAGGLQVHARAEGQAAPAPLLGSEQLAGGGAQAGRGYLESAAVGDYGALGTLELRSPPLGSLLGRWADGWRLHLFTDAAWLGVRRPLPEQRSQFQLWSAGFGTRARFLGTALALDADLGFPLVRLGTAERYRPRGHLRFAVEL